ncbi:3-keto-disaccharide hydrolase [Calycomorphotria hydatis]|uniref:3-keto-alpha-glucoside-1,2-lyase/3-keto-2-hydroxy-glucal hydratase domain-containing protein n=1 Tax=Calycomorphotria hydatis TaxID=2528027 RepID=A0A517T438_9PLAN|nr:DUF1080 domain-containing protein [Calycomorphotria hydatis]QDT63146.1 hypothetical protein V22_03640 [Calycomorphotria hydatis]
MPLTRLAFALLASLIVTTGTLFASEWISLDGDTLDEHWMTKGGWTLEEDGVIHLPKQEYDHWRNYENYLVLKDHMMADFEIEFDWKTDYNSGLYFHIPNLNEVEKRQHVEVQLFENSKWNKPKLGDHVAGGVIPGHAPTKDAGKAPGEWNHFLIRCVDNQLTVTLNGEVVNQVNLNEGRAGERSKFGGFAFQDHGFAVSLKNIRLKNLDEDAGN